MGYANRGKAFEKLIQFTNQQYKLKGWALVDQVPTPVQIMEDNGRFIKGFKKSKSTVDFVGVSHGRAIAFDAKSTRVPSRFDLKNVHDHQVEYLKRFQDQGGVAFLLIHFEKKRETFFMPFDLFYPSWVKAKEGGPKSIKYDDIHYHCNQVKSEKGVALHYLKYCG